eukprot:tig00000310_g23968.t1
MQRTAGRLRGRKALAVLAVLLASLALASAASPPEESASTGSNAEPTATYVVVLKSKLGEAGARQAVRSVRQTVAARAAAVHVTSADAPARAAPALTASISSFWSQAFGPERDGFSAVLSETVAEALRQDPRVLSVEKAKRMRPLGAQASPPWGLDRVDQRFNDLDGVYYYNQTGCGVSVYVVDTGINVDHAEFGGRAVRFFDWEKESHEGGYAGDCDGHGTHVAGIIASAAHGAAKRARVYSTRVFGCDGSGSDSGIIDAIEAILKNHTKPAVVSMSLGGEYSLALNDAIRTLTDAGLVAVVAAGNEDVDACLTSPPSSKAEPSWPAH